MTRNSRFGVKGNIKNILLLARVIKNMRKGLWEYAEKETLKREIKASKSFSKRI